MCNPCNEEKLEGFCKWIKDWKHFWMKESEWQSTDEDIRQRRLWSIICGGHHSKSEGTNLIESWGAMVLRRGNYKRGLLWELWLITRSWLLVYVQFTQEASRLISTAHPRWVPVRFPVASFLNINGQPRITRYSKKSNTQKTNKQKNWSEKIR